MVESPASANFRQLHDSHGKIYKALGEIDASLARGLKMTRRVMANSARKDNETAAPDSVDLVSVVAELESIYKSNLNQAGITFTKDFSGSLPVVGHTHHLHSVLQNLLLNARDAILG